MYKQSVGSRGVEWVTISDGVAGLKQYCKTYC